MSFKPIFVVTHPRSCSTAFERVFMTRDDLICRHEPFGDAFYYGPERLSPRFQHDEKARLESGFSESTYKIIVDSLDAERAQGKRLFLKDMAYYLCPPEDATPSIVPTLRRIKRGVGTADAQSNGDSNGVATHANASEARDRNANPTVLPSQILEEFHFTFLIRHPRYSIPSYFRCTRPPLDEMTGFYDFVPSEAGYAELRRLFDYLCSVGQVGPNFCGNIKSSHGSNGTIEEDGDKSGESKALNGSHKNVEICMIDADDLLDHPADVVSAFCKSVGIEYQKSMLTWNSEKDQKKVKDAFEKWKGFHEDAINSSCLKARTHHKEVKSDEEEDTVWREKFGEKGAKIIRETVNANVADYEYLKKFAMKF